MYKIWSTYRPVLWHTQRGIQVAGGTVTKLMLDDTPLPVDYIFPKSTTLQEFEWMNNFAMPAKSELRTRTVSGSKGDLYTITMYPNGKETCTCMGYQYRRKCKHIS